MRTEVRERHAGPDGASPILTSIKGAILDQAPANAYFWLFAGLAIGARSWAASAARSPVEDAQHQPMRSSLRPAAVGFASVRRERPW